MVGASLADHFVGRRDAKIPLGPLLEERLVVGAHLPAHDLVNLRNQHPLDQRPDRLHAAIEVDRRDQRLEQVGEDRRRHRSILYRKPFSHDQEVDQLQLLTEPAAGLAAHHHRLNASQVSLERIGERAVEPLADEKSQNRVAEKLKPLVGGQPMLCPGGVRQGGDEQGRVAEIMSDPPLAFRQVDAGVERWPRVVTGHAKQGSPYGKTIA